MLIKKNRLSFIRIRFLSSKLNMKCNTTILKRREKIKKSDTTNEIYINFIKSKKKQKVLEDKELKDREKKLKKLYQEVIEELGSEFHFCNSDCSSIRWGNKKWGKYLRKNERGKLRKI